MKQVQEITLQTTHNNATSSKMQYTFYTA